MTGREVWRVALAATGLFVAGCAVTATGDAPSAPLVSHVSATHAATRPANGLALSLPPAGFAVAHGDTVVLYTMTGRRFRVLHHVRIVGARFNRHPWLRDRKGRYLQMRGGRTVFRATRRPQLAIESEGSSCIVTDDSRRTSVKVCVVPTSDNELHTRLTVTHGGHTLTVRSYPPGLPGGDWEYGTVSPNGQQLLAQWSGECEVPQAYLVDISSGAIHPVDGDISADAPESQGLGWSAAGLPVVDFPTAACGSGVSKAGVYLTSTSGQLGHRLLATRDQVVMWF
jgi:hypothetical protein